MGRLLLVNGKLLARSPCTPDHPAGAAIPARSSLKTSDAPPPARISDGVTPRYRLQLFRKALPDGNFRVSAILSVLCRVPSMSAAATISLPHMISLCADG
jgi:hypothetical protein